MGIVEKFLRGVLKMNVASLVIKCFSEFPTALTFDGQSESAAFLLFYLAASLHGRIIS